MDTPTETAPDPNLPAAGWSGPDDRGHLTYTLHGPSVLVQPPKRDGYVAYWIGRHGNRYTRWVYKPVTDITDSDRRRGLTQ